MLKFLGRTVLALVVGVVATAESNAWWGSHGSYGGYGSAGSYGSHGGLAVRVGYGSVGGGSYGGGSYGGYSAGSYGSYGGGYAVSYGSHGPGPLRRLASRVRAHHGSYGSYGGGSYGSGGGYAVSYGSAGGYGYGSAGSYSGVSYGSAGSYNSVSYGSTGSVSYGSTGGYSVPVSYESEVQVHSDDCGCSACAESHGEIYTSAAVTTGAGMLVVQVPADAAVRVNGHLTASTGTERQFVSQGLVSGKDYGYSVEVAYTRDGKTVTETKQASLTAGSEAKLAFGGTQSSAEAVATKLELSVPADAKVTLAGAATSQTGEVREFVTTRLAAGAEWADYTVEVTATVDGQPQTKSKTVTLRGGEALKLAFDFASDTPAETLASRN